MREQHDANAKREERERGARREEEGEGEEKENETNSNANTVGLKRGLNICLADGRQLQMKKNVHIHDGFYYTRTHKHRCIYTYISLYTEEKCSTHPFYHIIFVVEIVEKEKKFVFFSFSPLLVTGGNHSINHLIRISLVERKHRSELNSGHGSPIVT